MSKRCLGCMELFEDELQVCPYCGHIVGTHAEEAIHIEPGTLLYDRYIVGKVLGYGGFGVTYIGWDGKLEQKVAIKEYLPGEFSTRMPGQSQVTVFNGEKSEQFHDGLKKFIEEAKHLAKFQNTQGIVKIFDSFEENETAYIIMEYLDGETLTEYLKREKTVPEDTAVEMLMPLMESLKVVHEEGLLHRDIAPDNVFLTKTGEVKLIDFGASRYATTSHSRSLTVIIKPGYSPEEQYRSRGDQGPHTDVYAVAATIYKMITGKTPPDAMERRAKYENQNKDILEEPRKLNKKISLNRQNAILNGMNVRIEDRTPDIATLMHDLQADPPVKRVYGKIKKIDLYSWPLWLKIFVPSILAVVITFGVLLLTGVIDFSKFSEEIVIPDNVVTVPDVEGLYKDEALKLITDGKLLATTDGSIESEYITAGKIILQTPVGGSYMDINGTVLLTISSGKSVASPENGISTVPFVIWNTKEDAISKLKQAGLAEPEIIEKHDESVAYGSVIAQSIEAGSRVDEGTRITLTVSIGPAAFEMPDVVGLKKEKAESELNGKGLVVVVEYKKDDTVTEGNVISQSVLAGSSVKRGDKVTIIVSSGKETVIVADVVGMTRAEAEKILKKQGFEITVLENYDSNVAAGNVISQSPGAGTAQLPKSTIVIYVSKGKQPITVKYDANGGKVSTESKSTFLSEPYGTLPTPTRSGYTFVGWYSAKSGGVEVKSSTIITTPSSHTLYAIWKANVYKVSFNPNGGNTTPADKSVTFNTKYGSLAAINKTGYTFEGWYTAASGGEKVEADTVYSVAGNQVLYAHWNANIYTVSFNANGGKVSTTKKSVTYDLTYGTLPTPTRTGYTFTGWYTDASGGTKVLSATKVSITSGQTLFAQWEKESYPLYIQNEGGQSTYETRYIKWGESFGELPVINKSGYTFSGWTTYGGEPVSKDTTMPLNKEGYAILPSWTPITYTITFDANGGSGYMGVQTHTYNSKLALSKNVYTKTNSSFVGWTTEKNTDRVDFIDQYEIMNLTQVNSANVTLYAVWDTISIAATNISLTRVPTGVSLSSSSLTLATQKSGYSTSSNLTATISGYTSPTYSLRGTSSLGYNISYVSSNTGIANVSSSGVITAVGNGSATITAKSSSGISISCVINVSTGSTGISWSSSSSSIASVSGGTVSAVGRGTATITAKTSNGYSATCSVKVYEAYKAIALNNDSAMANFHISNQSSRGLFLCNLYKETSFEVSFVTSDTVPSNGVIYQCKSDSGSIGVAVFFSNGKIAVRQRYNSKNSDIVSSYSLQSNKKYNIIVKVSTSAKCEITIKEEGSVKEVKTGTFNAWGQDGSSYASIGPKSSIFYGTAPKINLMYIKIVGTQGYYGYTNNQTYTIDFTNKNVGQTVFANGNFTAEFSNTSVQWCYR